MIIDEKIANVVNLSPSHPDPLLRKVKQVGSARGSRKFAATSTAFL